MKLTYWVAECMNDSKAYSIRARTLKEVKAALRERGLKMQIDDESVVFSGDYGLFSEPRKVTVEYSDGFDLLHQCLSEGSIYEGPNQQP